MSERILDRRILEGEHPIIDRIANRRTFGFFAKDPEELRAFRRSAVISGGSICALGRTVGKGGLVQTAFKAIRDRLP